MAKFKAFIIYFVGLPLMFIVGLAWTVEHCPYVGDMAVFSDHTCAGELFNPPEAYSCAACGLGDDATTDTASLCPLAKVSPVKVSLAVFGLLTVIPLLVLLLLIFGWLRAKPDFKIKTDEGMISVTQTAMRKFLRCICGTVTGISSVLIDIKNVKNKLDAKISVRVATPDAWLTVRPELQERIPAAIDQVMGPNSICSLEVVCNDLSSDRMASDPQYPTLLPLNEETEVVGEPVDSASETDEDNRGGTGGYTQS